MTQTVSWPHAFAVARRNASMYKRTWQMNLLPNFFEPVFYLAALGIGVGAYITKMGGLSYAEFLTPGLMCVAAMNGASFETTYNVFIRLNLQKTYEAMLARGFHGCWSVPRLPAMPGRQKLLAAVGVGLIALAYLVVERWPA